MDVLCVIPARGGSKGIPRKNLREVGGRSLLARACGAAREAGLDRVVVSTDDAEIAAAAERERVTVVWRPAELGADDTPMLPVVVDALRQAEERTGGRADAVALLQPTSPFRRGEHVRAAIDLLTSTGADSVVSVTVVPHRFVPTSLLRMDGDGRVSPYVGGEQPLRRQDKVVLYARNGPAVLVTRRATLISGSLYGAHQRALVMRPEESLDIDDDLDLTLAELMARAQR